MTRFIPREFTPLGMLERVNAYIENKEFCQDPLPVWPPLSVGQVFVSKAGVSCIDTCILNGNKIVDALLKYGNSRIKPYRIGYEKL